MSRRGVEKAERAIHAAYREHKTALVRYFRIRMASTEDCEDLLQELFLRLVKIDSIVDRLSEKSGNTRAFLFQIAGNLVRDRYRHDRMRQQQHHNVVDSQPSLIDEINPERVMAASEELDAATEVLNALPRKCREAFFASRLEGKSYRNIANEQGVSVSMIEKHISRALVALRDKTKT